MTWLLLMVAGWLLIPLLTDLVSRRPAGSRWRWLIEAQPFSFRPTATGTRAQYLRSAFIASAMTLIGIAVAVVGFRRASAFLTLSAASHRWSGVGAAGLGMAFLGGWAMLASFARAAALPEDPDRPQPKDIEAD